ncbi:MAG: TVP38/TMEM64 family protein [Gemmataceae bacterium]
MAVGSGRASCWWPRRPGATLAFPSSRFLFREFVERRFGRRLEALQRGVERNGAYYLFTLRLVPLVPFFLVNLGVGLMMTARTFAAVSLVGMIPGSFVYVNTGAELGKLAEPADVLSWSLLLSLALLGLLPLVLRFVIRRLGLIRPEQEKLTP